MDVRAYNREIYERLSRSRHRWTTPVTSEEIAAARRGEWAIQLTDTKFVPSDWFPDDLHGAAVLCLASGGGQQGPILAAAGASVVVLDISPAQLEMDQRVAERESLPLRTVAGDMTDLSMFGDESFDLIFVPGANSYIPDILPLWREAYRVLRPGGDLLAGFDNPVVYLFDYELAWQDTLLVRHKIPYSDLDAVTEEERRRRRNADIALEFGHTLDDQIGGQIAAGFVLTGFFEDLLQDEPSSKYIANSAATRAHKPVSSRSTRPREPDMRVGVHLIVEGYRAPPELLDDPAAIERAIHQAVRAGGARLLEVYLHKFEPHGITATALLAESHINIHTWPERQYFAADLFFCGAGNPEQAVAVLGRALKTHDMHVQSIERTFDPAARPGQGDSPAPRWWFERGAPPTIVQGLRAGLLHAEQSPHQKIEILQHEHLGRVLALDGAVQATTADEFVYHEMLVQVPLNAMPRSDEPAAVLIIGGGDGGALREVLRRPWVERVVMVELDRAVVRCSIEHLGIHGDFDDPRVQLVFADATEWVNGASAHERPFDVAIIDSPDPEAACAALYETRFYRALARCLAPDGLVSQHLGVPALQRGGLAGGVRRLAGVFAGVQVYRAAVPTYIGGDMAFAIASRGGAPADKPLRDFAGRHYNAAIHAAAFALPTWWLDEIGSSR
jgi:spermidine synthase/S-adenosylmethionine decarboxylase proenzyme